MTSPDEPGDLYGLPLDRFTAERDALAKRLRASGGKESADAVKGLRKPTLAMWALNQAVRRHPQELRHVLEATAKVRGAQRRLMGGGGRERFRDASVHRDRAIAEMTDLAASVLAETGTVATRAHTEAISGTLRALATHDELRPVLEAGRLTVPVQPSGFGGLTSLSVVSDEPLDPGEEESDPPAPFRTRDAPSPSTRRDDARATRLIREAESARDRAAQEAAGASRRWMKAHEEAERLSRLADEAQRRADELSAAAGSAVQEADVLRQGAEEARTAADAAEAELEALAQSIRT